jgi:hypothetical protein
MVVFCMFNHRNVKPSAASRAPTNAATGTSELRELRPVSTRSAGVASPR